MANNFQLVNPYTSKIPSGTLNKVQLTNPKNVAIQWPNVSGGNLPKNSILPPFLKGLFQ